MVYFGDDIESKEYKIFYEFAKENSKKLRFASNQFKSELDDMMAQFSDVKLDQTPIVKILKLSPSGIDKYKVEKITKDSL